MSRPQRMVISHLALILIACVLTVVVARTDGPLAIPAGLLLAFVVPGMTLVRAIPVLSGRPTDERIVLTFTLSLAVLVFGGLGLHLGGVRLTTVSWAGLCLVTIVSAEIIGLLIQIRHRTRFHHENSRYPDRHYPDRHYPGPDYEERGSSSHNGSRPAHDPIMPRILILLLAVIALTGAGWLTIYSIHNQNRDPFTALWISPTNLPVDGDTRMVIVGLDSHENSSISAIVKIRTSSDAISQYEFVLPKNSHWSVIAKVPASKRVFAELYRDPQTLYRVVELAELAPSPP